MESLITENRYCVFIADVVESQQGKVVFSHHFLATPEAVIPLTLTYEVVLLMGAGQIAISIGLRIISEKEDK